MVPRFSLYKARPEKQHPPLLFRPRDDLFGNLGTIPPCMARGRKTKPAVFVLPAPPCLSVPLSPLPAQHRDATCLAAAPLPGSGLPTDPCAVAARHCPRTPETRHSLPATQSIPASRVRNGAAAGCGWRLPWRYPVAAPAPPGHHPRCGGCGVWPRFAPVGSDGLVHAGRKIHCQYISHPCIPSNAAKKPANQYFARRRIRSTSWCS